MRLLAVIFGIALIVLVALDAFETIVLPRRVTRRIRLTRLFYRVFQFGSTSLGRLIRSSARRDAFRGYMGPLSLLAMLGTAVGGGGEFILLSPRLDSTDDSPYPCNSRKALPASYFQQRGF